MTTPSNHPEQQPGSQPDPEFWKIAATEGMNNLPARVAAGQQAVRDVAETTALEFENHGLDPDNLIDRELEIREGAAALVAKGTHTPEEAEAQMREHFKEFDEGMAAWSRRQGEHAAAYLERSAGLLTASLQDYAGSSLKTGAETGKTRLRDRLSRGKLGRLILGGAVAAVAAGGVVEGVQQVSAANQAEFEATQAQISPIIKDAMVDIDQQTLTEQRLHPETVHAYTNPDGHIGVTEFRNITGNVKVIMGNTEGKPDPNKPLFIDYRNNKGREGKIGTSVIMTSPEGNLWVDEGTDRGLTEFGGPTDGGWAAATTHADTTSRGFAESMPAPLEAAQRVAKTAQEQKPYDPYS